MRSFSLNSDGTAIETGSRSHVSVGPGAEPHWRDDGRELYYRSLLDGKLMAVEIANSRTLHAPEHQGPLERPCRLPNHGQMRAPSGIPPLTANDSLSLLPPQASRSDLRSFRTGKPV